MTDRERLVALLASWGVGFNGKEAQSEAGPIAQRENGQSVILCSQDPKIDGYFGFYAEFVFNDDGSFRGCGVWE